MRPITVLTGCHTSDDVLDEFYFSSMRKYGGRASLGNQVVIVSEVTGALLATGEIIAEGNPYEECKTVKVTQRFA